MLLTTSANPLSLCCASSRACGRPIPSICRLSNFQSAADAPSPVEQIPVGAAPAGPLPLELAAGGGLVADESDDVERIQYLYGVGNLAPASLFVPGERVHRNRPYRLVERPGAYGEPRDESLLTPALDHIQKPQRRAVSPEVRSTTTVM